MKDINKVILVGRLGADPVQRETKSGTVLVHFPLATSRRTAPESEGEEPGEETQWHRVVAWGKQGEVCCRYLKKGESIYLEGNLRSRKYSGKDGIERTQTEVHLENVSFLSGGRSRRNEREATAEAVVHSA
jgi:single-strand DNA-binding protein